MSFCLNSMIKKFRVNRGAYKPPVFAKGKKGRQETAFQFGQGVDLSVWLTSQVGKKAQVFFVHHFGDV